MEKPVVVLSGFTPGLGVIRSLGMMGVPITVIYHEKKEVGYSSKFVSEKLKAPNPQSQEEAYIEYLMECGRRYAGCLLIPASDETIAAVSRHKKSLEEYYVVACTEWAITEKFIDKRLTYEIAAQHGIPAPRSSFPHSEEDVANYASEALFPCLVKPSQSHRYHTELQKKMTVVQNLDQMLSAYREAKSKDLDVILQEYIPGETEMGANYNSYNWDGQTLVEFTAHKIRNAPPDTGSPCVLISKEIEEVLEPGRRILRALGFYGYACTEFKKDPRDGVYKLMEVNGRHNLSTLLSVRCGLNFPWIQYQHLMKGVLPKQLPYETGIYWIDISRDIGYRLLNLTKEHYTLTQLVDPYIKPHVFATFDSQDPKPALKKSTLVLDTAISKLSKRHSS